MTNYDLEELKLLKWQMVLSSLFIVSIVISLALSYNEIKKYKKQKPLFNTKDESDILIFNRTLALIIAIAFLYINYLDKNTKINYNQDLNYANLQIDASIITIIASLIVFYIAIDSKNKNIDTTIENPEI